MKNESYYNINDLITTLDRYYNIAPQQTSNAPLFELVLTLLSQHTSDHNSGRAMNQLINRFNKFFKYSCKITTIFTVEFASLYSSILVIIKLLISFANF